MRVYVNALLLQIPLSLLCEEVRILSPQNSRIATPGPLN
jgi:hypothetical protein